MSTMDRKRSRAVMEEDDFASNRRTSYQAEDPTPTCKCRKDKNPAPIRSGSPGKFDHLSNNSDRVCRMTMIRPRLYPEINYYRYVWWDFPSHRSNVSFCVQLGMMRSHVPLPTMNRLIFEDDAYDEEDDPDAFENLLDIWKEGELHSELHGSEQWVALASVYHLTKRWEDRESVEVILKKARQMVEKEMPSRKGLQRLFEWGAVEERDEMRKVLEGRGSVTGAKMGESFGDVQILSRPRL